MCYLGGFPGDGLAELFGVISEEIDTLYPSDRNSLCFLDGKKWTVYDYAEILRVQDAQILASYGTDFYEGSAALTVKEWESDTHTGENGRAYYIAARVAPEEMGSLFETMLANAGIAVKDLPGEVEYHQRQGEDTTYEFYLNHGKEKSLIKNVTGRNLLTGEDINETLSLAAYDVAVICKQS